MLSFCDVTRRYGGTLALTGVSFSLEPGALTVVTGDNGAGKSTLLRLAALLETPSTGLVEGVTRREIAWLGQEPGLYEELTVQENLRFVARLFGRESDITSVAAMFGISHKLDAFARGLSRGEKQRAALARASLAGSLMILDEPTSALDTDATAACARALHEMCGARTLLVATHDPEIVKRAHRTLRLQGGALA